MSVVNARWRAAYFACQAGATLAWWLTMSAVPACRRRFAFGDDGGSLVQFLPADVIFWMIGSCIAAWGERSDASWRQAARHCLAGALACSLVHATSVAVGAGAGWAGVVLMLPAVAMTWWLAWCCEH